MKYEAVFGDPSLFDGAPDGAEMVGGLSYKCGLFYKIVGGDLYASFGKHDDFTKEQTTKAKDIKVAAMRRIIADPKRWTVEDKKAGRLPEVDWVVRATGMNEDARIAAINDDSVCVVFEDGAFVTLHVSGIAPIETPAEKAQREEDEFIDSLRSVDIHDGTVSGFFNQGARAAYRKLKGGE